ncbi:MAG: lytic murein transglycosylase B [Lysobacteraceae bacterium]
MRSILIALLFALPLSAVDAAPQPVDRAALAAELAKAHKLDADQVAATLAGARYQQSIIDAITRPAEAKPWKAYRPIFMTEARISGGRAFLAEHRQALDAVARETGVPAEMIVAIIGVETNYGRNTGSHRVLDALFTLGAHYPPRQTFFRSELGHLFKLANEEQLDLGAIKGSYAGAMGWGQFMPSSYLAYARDGDGDGRRDLFNSLPDVFASIANYFVAHGWQAGQPVAVPALLAADAREFKPDTMEAKFSLAELGSKGYRASTPVDETLKATVINLEGDHGREHWIGFRNFYVISRYNRSPLYSLAVYQLSRAIADPAVDAAAP